MDEAALTHEAEVGHELRVARYLGCSRHAPIVPSIRPADNPPVAQGVRLACR
jgi:hypothetical protein